MSRWIWIVLLLVVVVVGGAVAIRKLSETEAARLARLRPEVRAAFERLRAAMAAQGIQLYMISTRRTEEEQAQKVEAGVSATNNSWHLLGRALDFNVQIKDPKTGKLRSDNNGEDIEAYRKVQAAAKAYGFRGVPNGSPFTPDGKKAYLTLANGKKIWDVFHLEFPEGMTFAQAKARDAKAVA